MSHQQLERTLRDLERAGTKISDGLDRQVWEFEFGGRRHRLHFYRRQRVSRAIAEFRGLTALQRAAILAPRAVALLTGFRIGSVVGDAVVVEFIEGFLRVDGNALSGKPREQILGLVKQLGQAKLGHARLELNAFATDAMGRMMIADGEPITRKGLRLEQVLRLAHSARRVATTGDVLRAWGTFGFGAEMPQENKYSFRAWRRFGRWAARGENKYFGQLSIGEWRGRFTKRAEFLLPWAAVTRLTIDRGVWEASWPTLLTEIANDQLEVLKRGDNGDVLRGRISVNGAPLDVIVKRPRRKSIRQQIVDVIRPSRARRTWIKTWKMLARDVPCEFPLLLMEHRSFGYVTDAVIVFAAVEGPTLAEVDLEKMTARARDTLFRRAGRILRRIESLGFSHMDAKSTNWIVFDEKSESQQPVLVDLDGVRHYNWAGTGIARLLRAMKNHSQYTPADSFSLCQGYAPRATIGIEGDALQPGPGGREDVDNTLHDGRPGPPGPG